MSPPVKLWLECIFGTGRAPAAVFLYFYFSSFWSWRKLIIHWKLRLGVVIIYELFCADPMLIAPANWTWLQTSHSSEPIRTEAILQIWHSQERMSGKVRQRTAANAAESATQTVNERILKECHTLYTDPENGKSTISYPETVWILCIQTTKKPVLHRVFRLGEVPLHHKNSTYFDVLQSLSIFHYPTKNVRRTQLYSQMLFFCAFI